MADVKPEPTVDKAESPGILRQLHDALVSHFALPKPTDRTVNDGGQKKGLMDAVDDAVNGAPAPGSQEY